MILRQYRSLLVTTGWGVLERVFFAGRLVLFPLMLGVTCLVALPSLLIGLVLWWRAMVAWDPREFWRGVWAAAVFGLVGYVAWIWLASPLPWLLSALAYGVQHHLWQEALQAIGLLWLLHILLAP